MAAIYRHYDRAALDVQYNARATVPDIQPILKRYAEASQQARDALPCTLDVPYGDHPDELLDIFPADGVRAAPVLVYIHGGYWRALNKSDSCNMAPAFTRAGALVVAVNYCWRRRSRWTASSTRTAARWPGYTAISPSTAATRPASRSAAVRPAGTWWARCWPAAGTGSTARPRTSCTAPPRCRGCSTCARWCTPTSTNGCA